MIGHVIMNFEGEKKKICQILLVDLVLRVFQLKQYLFFLNHLFHHLPAEATANLGTNLQLQDVFKADQKSI